MNFLFPEELYYNANIILSVHFKYIGEYLIYSEFFLYCKLLFVIKFNWIEKYSILWEVFIKLHILFYSVQMKWIKKYLIYFENSLHISFFSLISKKLIVFNLLLGISSECTFIFTYVVKMK